MSRVASFAAVFSICLGLPIAIAQAAVNNPQPKSDAPSPASTTVQGTAFGDKFVAGYAYAKKDPTDGTVFIMFGNGKTGGCNATTSNDETAFIGISNPAKVGSYSASPATANYSTTALEPRAFTSFKIDVKTVTDATIQGSVQMDSPKGTLTGDFNAVICP